MGVAYQSSNPCTYVVNDKQDNIAPKSVIAGESSNSVSRPTQISSSQSSVAQSKYDAGSSGENNVGSSNKNIPGGGGGGRNPLVDNLTRKRRSLDGVGMHDDFNSHQTSSQDSDYTVHDTNHDQKYSDIKKQQRILVNITIASDLGSGTESTKFYQLQVAVPTNFKMHDVDVNTHGAESDIKAKHSDHFHNVDNHSYFAPAPLTALNLQKEEEPIFDYNSSLTDTNANKSNYYYYIINGDTHNPKINEFTTVKDSKINDKFDVDTFTDSVNDYDGSEDALSTSSITQITETVDQTDQFDENTESTISDNSNLNNSFPSNPMCKGEDFL